MYARTYRACRACGGETVHWGEWSVDEPDYPAVVAWLRSCWFRLTGQRRWRCFDCDHPWRSTLPIERPATTVPLPAAEARPELGPSISAAG